MGSFSNSRRNQSGLWLGGEKREDEEKKREKEKEKEKEKEF